MRHKFPNTIIPAGQRCVDQICMICDCRSILYVTGARMYLNNLGKIIIKAPRCISNRQVHQFDEVIVPQGAREVIQNCLICNKERVVYANGSRAYFDDKTGARIPYVTSCDKTKITGMAKVISIPDFVSSSQINVDAGIMHEMYVMLYSIDQDGLTGNIKSMIKNFLESHRQKDFAKAN